MTIALTTAWDIQELNGTIQRISGERQILQLIETRLMTVQQEYFLDLSAGLPWFSEMTGRNTNIHTIRSYISNEIITTEGVESLQALDIDYKNRKLNINFIYTDIYGNEASGSL